MASSSSSSSRSWRYDVFPSFSGEHVRKSFLSHLLKELDRKSINTFKDHGIERSRQIGPELSSAIRESRISIVVFSNKYASSTWCLNELVEIHKCCEELGQMVIPIFYKVDPSQVRKQTGEFGTAFEETCKGKTDDQKRKWVQALAEVANMAGEDLENWCSEASMIEKIVDDLSNKLITPSNCFGDFVGIEAHLEAMHSMFSFESEEARMVGIVGPSGIGKSTIGRALFSQLSRQFHHRAFIAYKRTNQDDYGMKLCWEEQFLSEILGQKNLKISHLGVVEQKFKLKKVLIVLDDVNDLELLKTLVGRTGWFGSGSRIIVITQDRQLLKAHKVDLIYEVEFPSKDLALEIFCRSAFGQTFPPDGFAELADEVTNLAGKLPLGLSVLGSSLRGKEKEEWVEMLPRLQNGLDGKVEKTLRVGYDALDDEDKDLFLYIACLFNGYRVDRIKSLLGDSANNIGFKMLADKSLIRITPPDRTVVMHSLLHKFGRKIVRAESLYDPGERRFLMNTKDICDVFTNNTGMRGIRLVGIQFNIRDIREPFFIDEKSFQGMRNLQFLIFEEESGPRRWEGGKLFLPQGLVYLPHKLKLLCWDKYPSKYLPSNFKTDYLVELIMMDSKLEKLWEGTQPLGSLRKMIMSNSKYLKEVPVLSNAVNLEELNLFGCESLMALPSSIQKLIKLRKLEMGMCTKLDSFPTLVNLESLEYLNLIGCLRLRNFPRIALYSSTLLAHGISMEVEDRFRIDSLSGLEFLGCLMKCKFRPELIVRLTVNGNMLEKIWEGGVQPDQPDEVIRIQQAGGRVNYLDGDRVLEVFAISIASNNYLKPYVSPELEITLTDRTDEEEEECLILVSDGLWDGVSQETAFDMVRRCLLYPPMERADSTATDVYNACSDAASLLSELILMRHSMNGNNMSLLVVDVRKKRNNRT